MSQVTREQLKLDSIIIELEPSLSSLNSFSSWAWVAEYPTQKPASLFEFIYIFNNINFIWNIYTNIYIISGLRLEFKLEYGSVDNQVKSSWSRVVFFFIQSS